MMLGAATITLVVLKLAGAINMSWWWVFSPEFAGMTIWLGKKLWGITE